METKNPAFNAELSVSVEKGIGTDGFVDTGLADSVSVAGSLGPVSVDEDGRLSAGVGAGGGLSAGVDTSISVNVPDFDYGGAISGFAEDVQDFFR